MSKKMQLSDEILDAVAGGAFTYQGKQVSEMQSGPHGTTITMRDGSQATLDWNDETRGRLTKSLSSFFETAGEIDKKLFDGKTTYALEDYVK